MAIWIRIRAIARAVFRREHVERDLDAEVRSYSAMLEEENMARGMHPNEARRAARIELGGTEQLKDDVRSVRKGAWMETVWQDLCFGARMLRKNPGFTAVAVLTLALGIGANAAIFSVVNAVLLRPLPYPSPDRIVAVDMIPVRFVPEPDFHFVWADWADHLQTFDRIAAYGFGEINMAGIAADPERVTAAEVSPNFFETFGISPMVGRTFLTEEDVPGHPSVAIISYTLCARFGNPRDVIGKTILLNGKQTNIVGVMPPGFEFPEKTRVWLPIAWNFKERMILTQALFFYSVGRIKQGMTPVQAREELEAVKAREFAAIPKVPGRKYPNNKNPVEVKPLHDQLVGSSRSALLILLGAVGFVLLIACADVANLLLARAVQRQREIALRAALGASRVRLVRQGLTESLLLSSLGAAAGLLLAVVALRFSQRFIPPQMLFVQKITLDFHVFAFLLTVSVLGGLFFGLFPVMHALRMNLNDPLKEGVATSPSRGTFYSRARSFLAVAEIAMALVLLAGAGLMMKSFWRLINVDPGFQPERVLTARISLPNNLYQNSDQRGAFYDRTLARIPAIPGVTAAGFISDLPFGHANGVSFKLTLEHETPASLEALNNNFVPMYEVSPDYFHTMGIPLLAGRWFNDSDRINAPLVAVISKSFAETIWPGENPLGKRIVMPGGIKTPWTEIVGVVGDTKHSGLDEKPSTACYVPLAQFTVATTFLVVRTSGDPGTVGASVRHAAAEVDNTLPLSNFRTMNDLVSESVAEPRFRALLLGIFATLALILAAAGIYGIMSYGVAQRTREIGIRMAMGAGAGDILALILGQTLRLTVMGVAIGLAASWGLTRLLATSLYGVTPHDTATLIGVSLLLSGVALFASYIPARRAMRVDPMITLRYE
jgi:putative ABC transport system permease protein